MLDNVFFKCYNLLNLIDKGYDEDGYYRLFSQRVGGGVIPIKQNRLSYHFRAETPKNLSLVSVSVIAA